MLDGVSCVLLCAVHSIPTELSSRIVIKCTKQPVAIARKLDELDPAASPLSSPEALPNMRIGKRRGGNPNHAPLDADHRRIVPLPKRRRVTLVPDENR